MKNNLISNLLFHQKNNEYLKTKLMTIIFSLKKNFQKNINKNFIIHK